MQLIQRRIKDKKILSLIWKFLRAGIMEQGTFRHSLLGTPQGGRVSPLLANIYLHELDRYMERYTELPSEERRKRKRQGLANFLYVRYADDWVVWCDGTREQAEARRQELYEFLRADLKLELSLEKTKVTHVHDGFEFLGFLIDRNGAGHGRWAPRIRIPERAVEKIRDKLRAALAPETYHDSVRTKILGLNQIIGGWCRSYQTTSSPSYYCGKLGYEVFWLMAHWLGRKYEMSIPKVLKRFKREDSFGTRGITRRMPTEYKAKRHPLREIQHPYMSNDEPLLRENLDSLDVAWLGTEERRGTEDLKEEVYRRDKGTCGLCNYPVPWEAADLDHRIPRWKFDPPESGDTLENLWILHREPCHRKKTTIDLQRGRRVR
jgi:RNA-directed DNA polymerase